MKNLCLLFISTLLLAVAGDVSAQCSRSETKFYMGIGTGFSTFVGGEFGKRFAMRVSNSRYDYNDYYNNYYYNRYNYYDNYYNNDNSSFNPLHASITFGVKTSELMSIELNSGVLWHTYGDVAPVYESGTYGENDYTDRFDNSSFFAIPIMATVKLYPLWKINAPLYFSFGYGGAYMHEKLNRVREFYSPNSYNNYYGNYSYPIAEYSDSRWMHAISAGMGYTMRISGRIIGDVELSYTNYFSEFKSDNPLAMNNTGKIGYLSLGMKIYLGL